jgi:hypothetical protein
VADTPAKKAAPKKATRPAAAKPDLPDHKDDLAALAITRGVPSYEAWAMTVPELTKMLEA